MNTALRSAGFNPLHRRLRPGMSFNLFAPTYLSKQAIAQVLVGVAGFCLNRSLVKA